MIPPPGSAGDIVCPPSPCRLHTDTAYPTIFLPIPSYHRTVLLLRHMHLTLVLYPHYPTPFPTTLPPPPFLHWGLFHFILFLCVAALQTSGSVSTYSYIQCLETGRWWRWDTCPTTTPTTFPTTPFSPTMCVHYLLTARPWLCLPSLVHMRHCFPCILPTHHFTLPFSCVPVLMPCPSRWTGTSLLLVVYCFTAWLHFALLALPLSYLPASKLPARQAVPAFSPVKSLLPTPFPHWHFCFFSAMAGLSLVLAACHWAT